jgi:hypothetical protein
MWKICFQCSFKILQLFLLKLRRRFLELIYLLKNWKIEMLTLLHKIKRKRTQHFSDIFIQKKCCNPFASSWPILYNPVRYGILPQNHCYIGTERDTNNQFIHHNKIKPGNLLVYPDLKTNKHIGTVILFYVLHIQYTVHIANNIIQRKYFQSTRTTIKRVLVLIYTLKWIMKFPCFFGKFLE